MELPFGWGNPGSSAALRRDLRYVRHRLRELAEPGNTKLDVAATRRELLRLLRDVDADDREAEERVFQLLDASRPGHDFAPVAKPASNRPWPICTTSAWRSSDSWICG